MHRDGLDGDGGAETGVTYQWQVTADTPEGPVRAPAPPAPDARFRVIDAAAGKTLDRDLARAGSSKLLKGLLLAQAGVLDEAEQAFEALQAENPDSKRVADLLARVRERRLAALTARSSRSQAARPRI